MQFSQFSLAAFIHALNGYSICHHLLKGIHPSNYLIFEGSFTLLGIFLV